MTDNSYKPGELAPESGQYKVVGSRGADKEREITMVQGKTFPPAPSGSDIRYVLVDLTKHKK